ncbi:MAG: NAD(P)H-hydrate dehydratase [Clostridiales bacterium]|nr:NAD(P)H-hydrate dehydratase [Clostridiales bacterium]
MDNTKKRYIEREDLRPLFLPLKRDCNKGDNGRLIIVGGSKNYVGAPLLASCGAAAMRTGAGTSMLAVPGFLLEPLYQRIIFSGLYPLSERDGNIVFNASEFDEIIKGATAFAIGMGMAKGEADKIVSHIYENTALAFVLDADGLRTGANAKDKYSFRAVFTPHPKEFSFIAGVSVQDILSSPEEIAKKYAKEKEVILLLKGSESIITDGERVLYNKTGNPRLSKGGSGDVLSGVIGALLARGFDPFISAAAGAYICGLAADLSTVNEFSHLPTDTVDFIPKAIDFILKN